MSSELSPIPKPHFSLPAVGQVDLLSAFLGGRSPHTLKAYDRDIADFARFLGAESSQTALQVLTAGSHGQANAIALAYRTHMTERGLKTATIGRRLAALRSVVKLARTLGMIPWALEIASPKTELYRDTSGPGDEGWRKVLALAKLEAATGTLIGIRNLLLVRMLHDLGLRRGEAVSIDIDSIDIEGGTVAVVGKGRTETVTLTMPEPVKSALTRWLEVRGTDSGPLFLRLDRAAVTRDRLAADGVHKIIDELGRRAGLTKRLRPHGLRHVAITQVLDKNGGDLRAGARFSRHKDIRMLTVYDDNRTDLAGQMAKLISED